MYQNQDVIFVKEYLSIKDMDFDIEIDNISCVYHIQLQTVSLFNFQNVKTIPY